ncbi:methyl-accepting chemotaxis sensory transducer [Jannaschia sp. CCS1]|uniref:methyl-accepting chemotaxis sensory transducer n=1 Tax=Jannaschia sp. (strain CCS1) TaxID=290400 RepID=UPI000053BD0A|nr:methyl-accepting chemotaxis sensory transducer [Jannaschia sp. CCS1]ABD54684.1 methyl-accepting chemotaxis sensory transducer [Jannaschia sp. CCS1]
MADTTSLPDLSGACFVAVGPARIAACALALLCEEDRQSPEFQSRFETSAQRIKTAQTMLMETFPSEIHRIGHIMSDDLEHARRAALDSLTPLLRVVDNPLDQIDDSIGCRKEFRDHFFRRAEPDISHFLALMTAELAKADATQRADHKSNAIRSIENASSVGRAISMISVNASIEASRSGNQGFRVIADEIKTLAAQTEAFLREVGEAMHRS